MTREEFISMMGYRDDSPLRNEKRLDIQTGPNGIIDMSNTGTPLMANGQYLAPYSGHHQFAPNSIVTEIPLAQTGWEVPKREGVRENKDGTHSTHLMRTETLDGINWFSFPSLFQDKDGTWIDMSTSLEEEWMPVYQEALKRGEVIDFGTDKEAAIKFGEGSWKKELRNGGESLPKAQDGREWTYEDYSSNMQLPEKYNGKTTEIGGVDIPSWMLGDGRDARKALEEFLSDTEWSGTAKGSEESKAKLHEYLSSDKYRERLTASGYEDVDATIAARLSALNDTNIESFSVPERFGSVTEDDANTIGYYDGPKEDLLGVPYGEYDTNLPWSFVGSRNDDYDPNLPSSVDFHRSPMWTEDGEPAGWGDAQANTTRFLDAIRPRHGANNRVSQNKIRGNYRAGSMAHEIGHSIGGYLSGDRVLEGETFGWGPQGTSRAMNYNDAHLLNTYNKKWQKAPWAWQEGDEPNVLNKYISESESIPGVHMQEYPLRYTTGSKLDIGNFSSYAMPDTEGGVPGIKRGKVHSIGESESYADLTGLRLWAWENLGIKPMDDMTPENYQLIKNTFQEKNQDAPINRWFDKYDDEKGVELFNRVADNGSKQDPQQLQTAQVGFEVGQTDATDLGAGLWEALKFGAGTVADYYTGLKELADDHPVTKEIFETLDPVTKLSDALGILSVPGSLVAEAVEGMVGKGDGEFNFMDALPSMSGDFSFTNVNGTPTKTVAGVAGIENPWAAFGVNLLSDPSTYVGAGLAKNLIKKGIKTGAKTGSKSIDKAASNLQNIKSLNTKNFNDITISDKGSLADFSQLTPGSKEQLKYIDDFTKNFKEAGPKIQEHIADRVKELSSPEGMKRLVAQEMEYLEYVGHKHPKFQAEINALSRIEELEKMKIANSGNFVDNDIWELLMKNSKSWDNASYHTPHSELIKLDSFGPEGGTSAFGTSFDLARTAQIGGHPLPGTVKIGLPYADNAPVIAHEVSGHGLQRGRMLPIDKEARKLIKPKAVDDMSEDAKSAWAYFKTGSKGKEPNAFLHELREAMLQRGLIKSRHQQITPHLIDVAKVSFKKHPMGVLNLSKNNTLSSWGNLHEAGSGYLSNTRILDFMADTPDNSINLSKLLNKLPAMAPIAIGTGTVLANQRDGGEQLPKAQVGNKEFSVCNSAELQANGKVSPSCQGGGYRESPHSIYGSYGLTAGKLPEEGGTASGRVGLGYVAHAPNMPFTGHLGVNAGRRFNVQNNETEVNPLFNATGSVGLEGEFDRGRNSVPWGVGVYGNKDLINNTGFTGGLYAHLNKFSGKFGWNPQTGTTEATVGFGLPIRQDGGPEDSSTVNFNDLEKGIRHVESLNGVLMKNPQSSASGYYQDLFDNFKKNGIEYDGDRDAFIADTTFQKNLFIKRYNGDLLDVPGLKSNGEDLYNEYKDQVDFTYTPTEIAALSNMLGRQGTRNYLGNVLRDGQSLAEVFPDLYGDGRQLGKDGKLLENKTPDEYILGFNAALKKKALGGSVNPARERTRKLLRQYENGGSLTLAGRKHLEDIGVIDTFQQGGEYVVKRGDTLSRIARNYDMSTGDLASLNAIQNIHSIYPGQKLQLSVPAVTNSNDEEEEPAVVGYDHHESFSGAFGAAREELGVNNIFDYRGDSFVTNLESEPVNIPDSVRGALGDQQDQVDSLYSSRDELNITAAQDTWQEWDQKREDIADFNRMGNVDIITGYESGRLGGSAVESSAHTIAAGDNLTKLAEKYGSTVKDIMRANSHISHPDNIGLGEELSIPTVLGETYMILNKQTHELQAYRQGSDTPFATYLVGTGTIEGDAQTVTVSKDLNENGVRRDEGDKNSKGKFEVDWRAGNSQTGAGIFTLDGIVEKSQGYYDETGGGRSIPSFGLKNENGFRISTGIHGVPYGLRNTSRASNTRSDDITKKNMTHGCVNGRCSDLREMYDNPGITEGTKLYILPEEEGNEFVYQNGKLVFKSSAENRKRYSEGYTDEDGIEQPYSQGINRSPNALNYKPIKIEFDRTQMQKNKNEASTLETIDYNNTEEYNEITAPFLKALVDNKQRIMEIARVNGDTYNDMVKLTVGLFGQESGFGEKNSSIINAAKLGKKVVSSFFNLGTSSSADPLFEQDVYEGVNVANIVANTQAAMKGLPPQDFSVDIDDKSMGWTQLRWFHTDDYEKSKLAQLGITSNSDFNDPVKAAIGTIAILSIRSQTQTKYQDKLIADDKKFAHITNRQEALIAGWNPAGTEYVNNVLKQGNYATIYEIDAKEVAGELKTNYDKEASNSTIQNAIRLYEEYVEGWFEEGGEVKALYNKLNRVYYNDAKAARTGVLDHMKSLVN